MGIAVITDAQQRDVGASLVEALEATGLEAELVEAGSAPAAGLTAELANCLVLVEDRLEANPPDAVALVGGGDLPFAGVLVATKLPVPAFRVLAGDPPSSEPDNAALIDRLADHLVDGDAATVAESIERTLAAS